MKKRTRRKSPKSAMPTKKITIMIPVELDAQLYARATQYQLGISEMFALVIQTGLDALPPKP